MTAKDFLRGIRRADVLVKRKRQRVEELEDLLVYKGVSPGESVGGGNVSRTDKLVNVIALKDELLSDINKLVEMKRKGMLMIDSLSDPRMVDVFYRRYFDYMKWEDIANALSISTQWVHELHKTGLMEISRKFPEFR